jgi:cysteinyl-tRNA synthetase, unknown class
MLAIATLCAAAVATTALTQVPPPSPARPSTALAAVRSWGYQLQNIDPDSAAASPYDVLVLDYSREGGDAEALTPVEVARLKVKPDGASRIVLAYLSIGEAEVYRFYWKWYRGWSFGLLAPDWLGKHNAEWRGNYAVRYWHKSWQDIIYSGANSYLDRIINAGFDGVYLDKIDQYADLREERPSAAADMIALVKAIGSHARARKPGFLIVPQNGEGLLEEADYRAVIDGIGKEDLLFGENADRRPNDPASIDADVRLLRLLTAERKPVLVVEYLDAPREIERARARLLEYGFIPHFADRALDVLRIGDLPRKGDSAGRR